MSAQLIIAGLIVAAAAGYLTLILRKAWLKGQTTCCPTAASGQGPKLREYIPLEDLQLRQVLSPEPVAGGRVCCHSGEAQERKDLENLADGG